MESPAIVVLTGFSDIFRQFKETVDMYEPQAEKIVVTSRGFRVQSPGWKEIAGPSPFVFARNANLGICTAGDRDVLLINDDVRFTRAGTLETLRRVAHSNPCIGILSPQFIGQVGNLLQRAAYPLPGLTFSAQRLCFTCVYLKRAVIDRIGLLDERFTGYGAEDDDYCWRVQAAGLRLVVTPEIVVRHGFGKQTQATTSFDRTNRMNFRALTEQSTGKLRLKWPGKV